MSDFIDGQSVSLVMRSASETSFPYFLDIAPEDELLVQLCVNEPFLANVVQREMLPDGSNFFLSNDIACCRDSYEHPKSYIFTASQLTQIADVVCSDDNVDTCFYADFKIGAGPHVTSGLLESGLERIPSSIGNLLPTNCNYTLAGFDAVLNHEYKVDDKTGERVATGNVVIDFDTIKPSSVCVKDFKQPMEMLTASANSAFRRFEGDARLVFEESLREKIRRQAYQQSTVDLDIMRFNTFLSDNSIDPHEALFESTFALYMDSECAYNEQLVKSPVAVEHEYNERVAKSRADAFKESLFNSSLTGPDVPEILSIADEAQLEGEKGSYDYMSPACCP